MRICGSYEFVHAVAVTGYQQTGVWRNWNFTDRDGDKGVGRFEMKKLKEFPAVDLF